MRTNTAWQQWTADRDPEAGAALARRYDYVPDAVEALAEFSGRPGRFAAFARRRAMTPPADPGPVIATAVLDPSLEPVFPVLPRRYVAPSPAVASEPDAPELHDEGRHSVHQVPEGQGAITGGGAHSRERAERASFPALEESLDDPSEQAAERVSSPLRVHLLAVDCQPIQPGPPAARVTLRPETALPARPPAPPRQVAEVKLLRYWHDALSAVHRICRPDTDQEVGTIRLAVQDGCLQLFGRDSSRAHWVTVPAHTEGVAQVALPREAVLLREWGQAGKLSIFAEWLVFEPLTGGRYWCPAIPATMPAIPDDLGKAGAILHRDDLAAALREVAGGGRARVDPLEEVILCRADSVLRLESTRGTVTLPVGYIHGDLKLRIRPRLLSAAVACCPSTEVSLETAGDPAPLSVTSGWFSSLLATRSEVPYL
jgi:hypothetical protein